ncbi:hypothetical protein [Nonomuraea aurantiaca]|uniref:hypothetical protein n=1 Tax=Nonomuraea aurantiaca TaxID=2878562 RepID=UPI001CDA2B71|nr:hypothetical protein [Nonomuraea aurantiaca]MCA2229649.1 hypothetical protein [Nonomuraea aurantiaca]
MSSQNAQAITERDAAIELASVAERAHSDALDLAHEFDTALDQAHVCDLAVYMDVVAYLSRLDERIHLFEQRLDLVHTLAYNLELDHNVYQAQDLVRRFINQIAWHLPLDRPHFLATRGREVGGELSRALRELAWALSNVSRVALNSAHSAEKTIAMRPGGVSRSAAGLLKVGLQIVPSADRERYREELLADLHDIASGRAPKLAQLRYAINQVLHALPLRLSLRHPTRYVRDIAFRLTYWILSSDFRTWGLLGPFLGWGIVNIHLQQGWGSALFTLPGVVAFYAGIEWLRKRWRVK